MNGKIRVSIVATALHGSESKPYLNLVNNNSSNGSPANRSFNHGESLFNNNYVDTNVADAIDGATALKLDQNFEIKGSEEQSALINSYEHNEENKIAEDALSYSNDNEDISSGVSIESASYMEKNTEIKEENSNFNNDSLLQRISDEEHTPKLFSEENNQEEIQTNDASEDSTSEQLFDQDKDEDEDFEIPAFLRRQKF